MTRWSFIAEKNIVAEAGARGGEKIHHQGAKNTKNRKTYI
jgi:hypothetical protein